MAEERLWRWALAFGLAVGATVALATAWLLLLLVFDMSATILAKHSIGSTLGPCQP